MSLAKYSDTTDSGIEWLGEVPLHWSVVRLRRVAELNPSKSEVSDLDRELSVSFLPMEAVGDDGTIQLEHTRSIGAVENGYTYFREGDVTFAKITPCFENGKGAIMRGLLNGIGFGTTELIVVRPRPKHTTSDYLHWLFMSSHFRHIGESTMYGAGGQKRVPDDFVRSFATAIPPINEQKRISSFLDVETSKIDGLVSEQRRLIELLKEKRQAVISHAVTKGLNPNAPMKPSSIQWLGDVPQHWEVQRVKHAITSIEQGWSPQCENDPVESDAQWGVLKVGSVNYGTFTAEENKALPPSLEPQPELGILKDDLLISRANTIELVGSAAVAKCDHKNLMLCDKLYRLRMNHSQLLPEFLCYFLTCEVAREPIELGASGASPSMKNIAQSVILELWFAAPDVTEQKEIVKAIRKRWNAITRLLAEAERAIELLQERRTALISAAVTGKIDVRKFASKEVLA